MDRTQKDKLIATLAETFKASELVVVTRQAGLTVAEVSDLRRKMRAAGAGFKVAKNRLAIRALEGTRFKGIASFLKGPTAIAFSKDPVAAAKVAVEYANKNDKLSIVGASLGEHVLDVNGVKALATLPSLDEMRARLAGMLKQPATKIAGVLVAPAAQLARVFGAYAKKDGTNG